MVPIIITVIILWGTKFHGRTKTTTVIVRERVWKRLKSKFGLVILLYRVRVCACRRSQYKRRRRRIRRTDDDDDDDDFLGALTLRATTRRKRDEKG